jgi:hypothetical protein
MREKQKDSMMSQDHSRPAIDRRALLGGMATLGAGLAGSMIAPQKLHGISATAPRATVFTSSKVSPMARRRRI